MEKLNILKKISVGNIHIWLSLFAYLFCLFLTAFYFKETHEPVSSIFLLLSGWMGIVYLPWYANLLYFISLSERNNELTSSILSFIALLLGLSFLLFSEFNPSGAPGNFPIVSYGWGFYLWIATIGLFSLGQFCQYRKFGERKVIYLLSIWIIVSFTFFAVAYFRGENCQFSINQHRQSMFDKYCSISGQHIYIKVTDDIQGLFFESESDDNSKLLEKSVRAEADDGRSEGISLMNNGYLVFVEARNLDKQKFQKDTLQFLEYKKYEFGVAHGEDVGSIQSKYSVSTRAFDIPKLLALRGAEISIKNLKNGSIVSKTSYIIDELNQKSCGFDPGGSFEFKFIRESLNLTKKYASIFYKQ